MSLPKTQVYPVFNISPAPAQPSESTPVLIFDNKVYDIPAVPEIDNLEDVKTHIAMVTRMEQKPTWTEEDFDETRKLLKVQFNFDDDNDDHLQQRTRLRSVVYQLRNKYYTKINVCNADNRFLNLPQDVFDNISVSLAIKDFTKLREVARALEKKVEKFRSDLSIVRRSNWAIVEEPIHKKTLEFFGKLRSTINLHFNNFTWLCLDIPLILTRTIQRKRKIIAMPFTFHIFRESNDTSSSAIDFTVVYGNTYDEVKFKGTYDGRRIQDLSISNRNDQSFIAGIQDANDWVQVCSSWIAFQACKVLNASCYNFAAELDSETLSKQLSQPHDLEKEKMPFLKDIVNMYKNWRKDEALDVYHLVKIFDFDLTRSDEAEAVKSAIEQGNSELTSQIPVQTQTALFNLIGKTSPLVNSLEESFIDLDRSAPRARAQAIPGVVNGNIYEQEVVPLHYHISLTTEAKGGRRKNKKQVYVKSKDEVIYKGKSKVNSKGGNTQYIKIKNQDTKTFEYKRVKK